jgi:hypothetical protein
VDQTVDDLEAFSEVNGRGLSRGLMGRPIRVRVAARQEQQGETDSRLLLHVDEPAGPLQRQVRFLVDHRSHRLFALSGVVPLLGSSRGGRKWNLRRVMAGQRVEVGLRGGDHARARVLGTDRRDGLC